MDGANSSLAQEEPFLAQLPSEVPVTIVWNKLDLTASNLPLILLGKNRWQLGISAKTKTGLKQLIDHLTEQLSLNNTSENSFSANARHLALLDKLADALAGARQTLIEKMPLELTAEQLRLAHQCITYLTGEEISESLFDSVFSRFCVGK